MRGEPSLFIQLKFWVLVLFSLGTPILITLFLITKRRISRITVAVFGVVLIILGGIDVVVLQHMSELALQTTSSLDDEIFASEYALALYVLPLTCAGLGVNLLSHLLHAHLILAELEYDREQRQA